MDTVTRESLASLRRKLHDPELTPEQLARLVAAVARQHQALVKAQAQKIANGRYARERLLQKRLDRENREHEHTKLAARTKLRTILDLEKDEEAQSS